MNRLADSTSPYLLQHRDNPVDWHMWGEEAFAEAAARNVPILLSVGYSSCHWCHVMAHESFEDPATAAEMNRLFVNVKVDREERPDVDAIYMEAVQTMTGRGGWPMTVWLTPDGRPFYAGTYFPNTDRHGMPSFRRILEAVSASWVGRQGEVEEQAAKLTEAIARALPPGPVRPDLDTLQSAYHSLEASFDFRLGGFGPAPKFPQQPVLEFLLRIRRQPWASRAGQMVRLTLQAMAAGGIHDQLGGGFARYSVDEHWLVPHFEKMLYDNAQLARLYLWAGIELDDQDLVTVARSTLEYLLRDMQHPAGGFYSAEDADSEGVEGKFYVWSLDEVMEVAGPEDGPVAAFAFGITEDGNFEGSNILTRQPDAAVSNRYGPEGAVAIKRAAGRMLESRNRRVRPGLDDKMVAAWNGLALRALAEAGAALHEPRYVHAARRCATFLITEMKDGGRMIRSWRDGSKTAQGFLDDQAATAIGLFALYAATGEVDWFRAGRQLVASFSDFADGEGGFFSTAANAEALIKRPRDQFDNPSPSGSALAAEALLIYSLYTGDSDARTVAESAVDAAAALLTRYPSGAGHHLSVLSALELGTFELAVTGPEAADLAAVMWEQWHPAGVLAFDPSGEQQEDVPLLAGRFEPGRTLAYVCEGFVCSAPVERDEALRALLADL